MAKKNNKTQDPAAGPREVRKPSAPEMEGAWKLLAQGNNRAARRAARAVLASTTSTDARTEAEDLLSRIALEPGVVLTIACMVALLTAIVVALALRR